MADKISAERRSSNMRAIRATGMKPELLVRKLVHRLGYRYRLHVSGLPGSPDLVFPARKKVIFVHGCFWHQHKARSCPDGKMPKSNLDYWKKKLEGNIKRDQVSRRKLKASGWGVLVIWECDTGDVNSLITMLKGFLE